MILENIKGKLAQRLIEPLEGTMLGNPTVIGYEKKFKWSWMATQMNTFIVATDMQGKPVTPIELQEHLNQSYAYAKKNYTGWPKGLQSGISVISILISDKVDPEAASYCTQLKSGKKWAAMTIPIVIDSSTKEVHLFEKNPMWGRIYYPYFKKLIKELT
ncbi:hypothetical protein [Costertonia aggregata]|uniref:Uncharacterized protein n=1 Tax=Costertonia aggregata TaxID=343403 RepID=A0A7H9AN26_9FLAO|nr:hypothetical protein [Costertonia aggregata]QLG44856.1 hypothetical protein HYG79_05645 [Costertonia aggregata]